MNLFTAEHISAGYSGRTIVKDVSFSVKPGCLLGILGANGSGKTTLLKALCGILPHTGRCTLEGQALTGFSPRQMAVLCSYIPQRSGITIDMSALDVVLMGFNPHLRLLEYPNTDMKQRAAQALERVGLSGMAQVNYQHLSEGQKQLCILARTLVGGSRLLLMDEPESALDFHYRHQMLSILQDRIRKENSAAILTLHDPALALNACDSLLLLGSGGALAQLFPQEDALPQLEEALGLIYGPVSLHRVKSRSGQMQLVMLREENPCT